MASSRHIQFEFLRLRPLFGSPCTDVDVKVDALAKLQAEFESGAEVRCDSPMFRAGISP